MKQEANYHARGNKQQYFEYTGSRQESNQTSNYYSNGYQGTSSKHPKPYNAKDGKYHEAKTYYGGQSAQHYKGHTYQNNNYKNYQKYSQTYEEYEYDEGYYHGNSKRQHYKYADENENYYQYQSEAMTHHHQDELKSKRRFTNNPKKGSIFDFQQHQSAQDTLNSSGIAPEEKVKILLPEQDSSSPQGSSENQEPQKNSFKDKFLYHREVIQVNNKEEVEGNSETSYSLQSDDIESSSKDSLLVVQDQQMLQVDLMGDKNTYRRIVYNNGATSEDQTSSDGEISFVKPVAVKSETIFNIEIPSDKTLLCLITINSPNGKLLVKIKEFDNLSILALMIYQNGGFLIPEMKQSLFAYLSRLQSKAQLQKNSAQNITQYPAQQYQQHSQQSQPYFNPLTMTQGYKTLHSQYQQRPFYSYVKPSQ